MVKKSREDLTFDLLSQIRAFLEGEGHQEPELLIECAKLANDVASLACGEAQAAIDRMGARVQSNLCGPSLTCAFRRASST